MNRLPSLAAIAMIAAVALLDAGCASQSAIPATTANLPPANAARPASQVVELRHFYLLSPGPSATLVVTRSDLTTGDR